MSTRLGPATTSLYLHLPKLLCRTEGRTTRSSLFSQSPEEEAFLLAEFDALTILDLSYFLLNSNSFIYIFSYNTPTNTFAS